MVFPVWGQAGAADRAASVSLGTTGGGAVDGDSLSQLILFMESVTCGFAVLR